MPKPPKKAQTIKPVTPPVTTRKRIRDKVTHRLIRP